MTTLQSLFSERFAPVALRGKADHTRMMYQSTLNFFDESLGRSAAVEDLNAITVSKFLDWFAQRPRVKSARTVNNRRQYIVRFWTWAAKKGHCEEWPEDDVIKLPEPEITPDAWTLEEYRRILASVDQEDLPYGRQPGHIAWRALFLWFYDTGERSGATQEVEWDWYDAETGVVEIPSDARKDARPLATC